MVEVTRHRLPGPDSEDYARALGEDTADSVRGLVRAPDFLGSTMNTAVLHVQARCLVDPQASGIDTWEAVVTAMQVGSAMFAAASATDGAVECRINHEVLTIPAVGPEHFVNPGNWLTAFWFAIICRDQKRMTQLCRIPLDLMRASQRLAGYEIDDYAYHWVDTLQAYWLRRPDFAEKLILTFDTSHPNIAVIAGTELLNKILFQPVSLFHRFVTQDVEGFNTALVEALEAHRSYWTADEDRAGMASGNIAIGPLAIACLAYDGKIPLRVTSDYIPLKLLDRAWVGEFPT